ncbi:phenylalanine--tRNA ligase subunit beta [Candidatus Curculioniphilus buchneri]|uniref:phenylalanine--tRNA ligase subunit beta n=1 Tax=Candidatus Curculioniphilus buchneri TaxID=690594 RepID=UPI00376ED161
MKFSELWLREWVNLNIDMRALTNQMTMAGLKVENVEPVTSGLIEKMVIGRIVTCQQHPNIDKWQITKVDIGRKHLLNIICKAQNCRTDLRVVVANFDSSIQKNCKSKMTKAFSEFSEGMLCSFEELGIVGYYTTNIIELPMDAPIGYDVQDYLKLEDNIINISVTPNRADCLSLLGIARDIAAFNRITLQQPTVKKAIISPIPLEKDAILPVRVDAPHACPRYLCRIVKHINTSVLTPIWMSERLRRSGLQAVNVVVDITNYVLLELGQPMHVFDLKYVNGGIVVRKALSGEKLILLNGSEVVLSSDTLIIADHYKILALAGILGGAISSVSSETKDIILESAFFNPLIITNSVRHYNIQTHASRRYEYGVDPNLQLHAIERTTELLISICGGKPGSICSVMTQCTLPQFKIIHLRRNRLNKLIGYIIPDSDVIEILTCLGCHISQCGTDFQIEIPSWRFDLTIEEDIIEEIIRIYGYELIPNTPIHIHLAMPIHYEKTLPLTRVKELLVDRGYQEIITYSFVDPKVQALLHPQLVPLLLSNPVSHNMSSMRLSLFIGLLKAVIYNQNHQQKRIRLFESGLCFVPDNMANLGIRQDLMLGGVISGPNVNEHWDMTSQLVDFYDIKGDLESIFECSRQLDDIEFRRKNHPALHPGQSAAAYIMDDLVGFFGLIHPQLEAQLNLNSRTLIFELYWEKITACAVPKINDISRFPANRRDIAIVVKDSVAAGDIIKECRKINKNQLVGINVFDVYRGEGIAKGFKSLAISLILQDTTHTLEKKEIAATIEKCVAVLKQRFKASLRD